MSYEYHKYLESQTIKEHKKREIRIKQDLPNQVKNKQLLFQNTLGIDNRNRSNIHNFPH